MATILCHGQDAWGGLPEGGRGVSASSRGELITGLSQRRRGLSRRFPLSWKLPQVQRLPLSLGSCLPIRRGAPSGLELFPPSYCQFPRLGSLWASPAAQQ